MTGSGCSIVSALRFCGLGMGVGLVMGVGFGMGVGFEIGVGREIGVRGIGVGLLIAGFEIAVDWADEVGMGDGALV